MAGRTDSDEPAAVADRSLLTRAGRVAVQMRYNTFTLIGLSVLVMLLFVAVFASVLAPYDPTVTDVPNRLSPPSENHLFGTDEYGRDIFSRILFGTRIAFQVAIATPAVAMTIGVPIGLIAGYSGGRTDSALMRLMDAIFAFPTILLGLTLVAVFGQSLTNIVIAIGIVFIPQFARITRGSAMSAASDDHVKAAKSTGASDLRILVVHILPFCLSAILVQATIVGALAILLESSLSFLGVGVPPPRPSWGAMLQTGKGYINTGEWWYSVLPGLAIVVSILGFNLLGDGLRDIFDPRTDYER